MNELSLSEKREFYSSLLSLYDAGFSYADAFFTIETNSRNKNIKAMAQCIRFEIQKNVPFTKIITNIKKSSEPLMRCWFAPAIFRENLMRFSNIF